MLFKNAISGMFDVFVNISVEYQSYKSFCTYVRVTGVINHCTPHFVTISYVCLQFPLAAFLTVKSTSITHKKNLIKCTLILNSVHFSRKNIKSTQTKKLFKTV